jgi:hypothetical protein
VKFNRVLSQLEAVYQVAKPVLKPAEPLQVSDFIHHLIENQGKYQLEGWTEEEFVEYSNKNLNNSVDFINNILQKKGHFIARKSIVEGIEHFKKTEE